MTACKAKENARYCPGAFFCFLCGLMSARQEDFPARSCMATTPERQIPEPSGRAAGHRRWRERTSALKAHISFCRWRASAAGRRAGVGWHCRESSFAVNLP